MQDRDTTALVTERRERAAARWDLDRGVVLVPAGLMLPIAGTDQFHEYHAHPEHRYLAGVGQPGGVLAFDAGEGWTLFVPQPEAAERVWTGNGPSLAAVGDVSGLARVQAASTTAARSHGSTNMVRRMPSTRTRPRASYSAASRCATRNPHTRARAAR